MKKKYKITLLKLLMYKKLLKNIVLIIIIMKNYKKIFQLLKMNNIINLKEKEAQKNYI